MNAQRIDGRVAVMDVPVDHDDRVYLVERHIQRRRAPRPRRRVRPAQRDLGVPRSSPPAHHRRTHRRDHLARAHCLGHGRPWSGYHAAESGSRLGPAHRRPLSNRRTTPRAPCARPDPDTPGVPRKVAASWHTCSPGRHRWAAARTGLRLAPGLRARALIALTFQREHPADLTRPPDQPQHRERVMTPSTDRLQQIAVMYATHADELRDLVRRRASGAQPATIDDACSFAWTELISAEHIDVRPPRWGALAWLTTPRCTRRGRSPRPSGARPPTTTASSTRSPSPAASATPPPTSAPRCRCAATSPWISSRRSPSAPPLSAALGARLQLPRDRRRRRRLLRTTDRQITRAKRRLEQIAAADGGEFRPGGD